MFHVLSVVNSAVTSMLLRMNVAIAGVEGAIVEEEKEKTDTGSKMDVEDLLSKTGAEEGSLSGIKDLVVDYGAGSFNIIQIVLLYVVATVAVGTIIGLIIHASNPGKVSEKKTALIIIFVAAVIGFAVTSIIIFASNMGASLLG